MMIDLTQIIQAVIALFVAIAVRFIVPWVRANTTEKDREDLLKWVEIAVMAADQLYWQSSGPERKAYVMKFLHEKGFDVNDEAVNNAIEAAVLALHKELEG